MSADDDSVERDPEYWLPPSDNALFSSRWLPLWTLLRVALEPSGFRPEPQADLAGVARSRQPMKQLWTAGRAEDCGLPNALQWMDVYIVLPAGDLGFAMACTGISIVELVIGVALVTGLLSAFFALLGGLLGLSLMTVDPYLSYLPLGRSRHHAGGWLARGGWWGLDRWLLPLLGAPWTSHRYPAAGRLWNLQSDLAALERATR